MLLDELLRQAFVEQFCAEHANSRAYLQMSYAMEMAPWDGFAKFLKKSSEEETEHACGFANFLIARNQIPELNALDTAVGYIVKEPLAAFQNALNLEKANTQRIVSLTKLCWDVGDIDAFNFMKPYLEEQRTSEKELLDIVNLLSRAGGNTAALLEIQEMLSG